MDLNERVAVITGGASGIGRACALAMARSGARIVIADVNEQRTADTLAEIEAIGGWARGFDCDVTRDGQVEGLAERVLGEVGRADLLMSNAGVVLGGRFEQISIEDWRWILDVNLLGPIRCLRAFLPHMLQRGSGYVVNTASFAGLVAHNPLTIPYDTTKHGVVGLSAGLALYLRPKGIGVSVLCPGYVATNLSESYRFRGLEEAGVGPAQIPDSVVSAEEVAEKVVDAVQAERFLILSQPEHAQIWARRARDIDAHIARQLEVLAGQQPAS